MLNFTITTDGKSYNAINDWNCFPKSYFIGEATPKYSKIEVPYRNGTLDLSNVFGDVAFNEREIQIPMLIMADNPAKIYSEISNAISGKVCQISFNDDLDYYYEGRTTISALETGRIKWSFIIDIMAFPFKYKKNQTIHDIKATVNGTDVICSNSRMPVYPTITTNGSINIEFGGETISLNSGTHTSPLIKFVEGDNELLVKGSATVRIQYREGSL